MRIPRHLTTASLFPASLLFFVPAITLAGGGNSSPSPKPKPDTRTVKVWTNEDVQALGPRFTRANEPTPPSPAPATAVNVESAPILPHEKDPRWYAQQLAALNSGLSSVSEEEGQLRHFRETSTGLPTGLNVMLPCNGITTDNRIAQLEARRQEILQQLDDLADTARVNDMPPGILVEGRGLVSAEAPLTAEQQREALVDRYENLTGQLAETQSTVAAMQAAAAAQHQTLLEPDPRWGGSLTANLLQNLYQQQSDLAGQLDATQDEMRRAGILAQ
jgi:hypothetical protein